MMESNRKKDPQLGNFLWSIIRKSGLTNEKLAEALHVSPRTIGYYCSGERKPNQTTLLRMLRITCAETKDIPF